MTYIELINNFWSVRRIRPMTSYEADFYFYLLKECNSRNWTNPFELPSRNVELELGISRKTICDLRNKLLQKGLISFKEGNRRTSGAIYEILYVSERNKNGNINGFNVSDGNQNGNESGNQNGNINGNQSGNPLYKTKNKTKTKKNNSGELFPPEFPETESVKDKKKFIAPTLDEVIQLFIAKGTPEQLPDCREQAEIFFNHFDSIGWRTSRGAKIERWESKANLWILDHAKQSRVKNETDTQEKLSDSDRQKLDVARNLEELDRKWREQHGIEQELGEYIQPDAIL